MWHGRFMHEKISCPLKEKNKTPNQEHAPCPHTANFDFKPEQCIPCPKAKHSDSSDYKDSCAWDTTGAHLDYPIGWDLFSCREKSVLKLRHWIKVSRTVFEVCGGMQPHWGYCSAHAPPSPRSLLSLHWWLCCSPQVKPKSVPSVWPYVM